MFHKYDGMILPPASIFSHSTIPFVGSVLKWIGIKEENKYLPKLVIAQQRCLEIYLDDCRELLFDLNMEKVSWRVISNEIRHIFHELKYLKFCANDRYYPNWNKQVEKMDKVSSINS